MKNYIYKAIIFSLVLVFGSCDLAKDLDDFQPQNALKADNAVTDQASAEMVLIGVYSNFLQSTFSVGANPVATIIPAKMSITGANGWYVNDESIGYVQNNPLPESRDIAQAYTGYYNMINRANWLIMNIENNTSEADFSPTTRRAEIIAEAKALRALNHFYLLRNFGQFYDQSSIYGIDLRTSPATSSESRARGTVAEAYASIHADLDDAIANAPYLRDKWYVNQMFARGLKAKVYLYQGDYANAATEAKAVMDAALADPNFGLTATFAELFDHVSGEQVYNNTEALLDVHTDGANGTGSGNFWDGFGAALSPVYYSLAKTGTSIIGGQVINHDDSRIAFISPLGDFGVFENLKYKPRGTDYETIYQLRMAEVYLIYAEAATRADGSTVPADALTALNDIRTRAGATTTGADGFETYPGTITYAEFLEAVRIEKMMELATENGETWFDLVRYDYADGFGTGFQASDVKSTATNSDKFILPIPLASIEAGGGIVVQNPSY